MNFHSLRIKIILVCAACIIVVGVASNTLLHLYLTSIITEKSDSIDTLTLQSVQIQLNQTLFQFESLGDLCANDIDIARAMRNRELETLQAKREALRAHEALKRYLSASNIGRHIIKLMAFNENGLMAQAASNIFSEWDDPARVRALPIFGDMLISGENRIIAVSPSIVNGKGCIAFLSPIFDSTASIYKGWLYIEMDAAALGEDIAMYGDERFFITGSGGYPLEIGTAPPPFSDLATADGQSVRSGKSVYRLHSASLMLAGLSVFSYSDVSYLSNGGQPILFTTVVVAASSLAAAIMLAVLLSSIITRPLGRLMERIGKIASNDFSFDPAIERGNDEIARTGKMLNEMTASFGNLLHMTEEMYKRQKNSEIALLQSQVNPHFLYNTLDSIHWMATIQKNTGIMKMTKSLSELLRSLSRGVNDKITLSDELSLLQDYVNIQLLRYMESFTFISLVPEEFMSCLIVKLTLQPLVENAIFHGIAPKALNGVITVDAKEEDGFLLITIHDDGVGMTENELETLTSDRASISGGQLSGMGVFNVHERLRLIYGSRCGLTYKSEKDAYTLVTVRIPKEVKTDV